MLRSECEERILMLPESYEKHKFLNLYFPITMNEHDYKDLDEEKIKSIILSSSNLHALSEDLHQEVTSWPFETNLSRQRHCLVRPFEIKTNHKVLEIGSGCGAITRYLGETGAEVIAVEGSYSRAEITALRCTDLSNVSVVVDNITEVNLLDKFDWIFVVGVLEYSRVYINSKDPVESFLSFAASHLNENGKLVIAIENQLGLNFFNGRSEDHVGQPFFGINDLYQEKSVVTFGRKELTQRVVNAGLRSPDYMYPFPDYKTPTVILSEKAFGLKDFEVANLLFGTRSRDYYGRNIENFDESLVYGVLGRNDLIQELAPSFLAVTGLRNSTSIESQSLAWVYSLGFRKSSFACETTFCLDPSEESDSKIVVKKDLLQLHSEAKDSEAEPEFRHLVKTKNKYASGLLLARQISLEISRNPTFGQVTDSLLPWAEFCLKKATCDEDLDGRLLKSWKLPGDSIESVPSNIIVSDGKFIEIDKEWESSSAVPLSWIIHRGIRSISRPSVLNIPLRSDKVFRKICEILELIVDEYDLVIAQNLEIQFRKFFINYDIPQPSNLHNEKLTWYEPVKYSIHGHANPKKYDE